MRAPLFPLFLFLCLLVTGCDRSAMIDRIATPQEQAFARQQVERLRARQFEAIEAALNKGLHTPELRATLEQMAAMVPTGEPRSVQVVGAQKLYRNKIGTSYVYTTIEYEFAGAWLLAQVVVADKDGSRTVDRLHVYPRTQSLAQENRLTLAGKGPVHYLFLVLALAALAVTLYALLACIRTRGLRRKWLWIPFILLGVGHFALNWTSGAVQVQVLAIQLLSASVRAQLGAPWFVGVAIPLGAIVFLLRRRRLVADA